MKEQVTQPKNKKISLAVKKRWKNTSKEKRSAFASKIATIKNKKMTKAQRSAHGKMMISKRFAKTA